MSPAYTTYLIDLDGVVYRGETLLPGAREFIAWLDARQVALILGISVLSVHALRRNGRLKGMRRRRKSAEGGSRGFLKLPCLVRVSLDDLPRRADHVNAPTMQPNDAGAEFLQEFEVMADHDNDAFGLPRQIGWSDDHRQLQLNQPDDDAIG